jgi:RNA polymerase sigma-70 factor, ECF subfamily
VAEEKTGSRRQHDERFAQLLTQYRRQIFRVIFCMVRNMSDAEDIFQQTAITMWDKYREFKPGSDFLAWGCSIARFKVRDFFKARTHQRLYFSEDVIDILMEQERLQSEFDQERLQALAACRQKLSLADQQLLAAYYGGENTVLEVASSIGRPVRAVYDSLWRIRRALHGCIQRTLASEAH